MGEILFALLIAILFTFIFSLGCRPRTKNGLLGFFLLLFLVLWAGNLWITPVGPVFYGIYWFPSLIIGLIFILLIVGLVYPPEPPRNIEEAVETAQAERAVEISFNVFFWTLLALLLVTIVSAYIW